MRRFLAGFFLGIVLFLAIGATTNRFTTPTWLTNYVSTNVSTYVTNYVETNSTLLQVVHSTNFSYDFGSIGSLTNSSLVVSNLATYSTNVLALVSVSGNVPTDFLFKVVPTGSNLLLYASNTGSNAVDPDSLYYVIRLLQ